jgi:predicted metalloprotease with PDZ domain
LVTTVVPGSPAELGGIQKGDLILAVNNHRLTSALELSSDVRQARPGTIFEISFIRHNSLETARVEVGSRSYYRLRPQIDGTPMADGLSLKVDSLTQLLDYLKSEVGRLEDRMKRLK